MSSAANVINRLTLAAPDPSQRSAIDYTPMTSSSSDNVAPISCSQTLSSSSPSLLYSAGLNTVTTAAASRTDQARLLGTCGFLGGPSPGPGPGAGPGVRKKNFPLSLS
ncbi:hypothetical protein INR49_007315 [Caranx melampygus]|nr:hypothetical protein INR49_007315 [Caranx melampygus]